jgi:4-amino-4-deoxy-L-arabinose transferase-like glycosyltransferase
MHEPLALPPQTGHSCPSFFARPSTRYQLAIVLVGVIVFFTNLGGAALFDMDEALYASCAREMADRGDWVVPWFNGEMSSDKPPLMFWLMILGTNLFGATEFAVRFPSAVFAIGTALATYHLGRLLFRQEVGFWAGVIVSTSIIYTVSARAATVDSALTFAVTAALLVLVADGLARRNPGHDRLVSLLPQRWPGFALMYAAIGVGVLAKGPVGVIMPVGAIGLFLLMMNQPEPATKANRRRPWSWTSRWLAGPVVLLQWCAPWRLLRWTVRAKPYFGFLWRFAPRRILHAAWLMRPLTALLVVGAVAVPWYVMVSLRTDGQWLYDFLAKYNLGPFVKPILGHSGPWFYHIVLVFVGFFPWSVFLGPTLVETYRRIRDGHPWRVGYIFVSCWAVAVIGFWSLVAMKLPHHILPAYPALALLTAAFVYAWITEPSRAGRWWMRNASVTLVVVGIGILVALPIVASYVLPGEAVIGLVGLTLVVGGALCFYFSEHGRAALTMNTFAVTSVVFLTAIFGFAVLRVDRHQNGPVLAAAMREAHDGPLELATFRYFRESFVFYSGSPVERLRSTEQLDDFLRRAKQPFVITTDQHEKKLQEAYPGEFTVLARHRQFLGAGDVVVLARRPLDKPLETARRPGAKPN